VSGLGVAVRRANGEVCGDGRTQLLVSPTLWGWLGSRLGIRQPAESRYHGRLHLSRLLGEMRIAWESAVKVLDKLAVAVRVSLSALVHNRREAWPMTQFRPGSASGLVLE